MLLQNLVDNILPRGDGLFGDAASADVNRSMLAEQLSLQLARSNRVGIASMLEKAHGSPGASAAGLNLPTTRSVAASDAALHAVTQSAMPWPKE